VRKIFTGKIRQPESVAPNAKLAETNTAGANTCRAAKQQIKIRKSYKQAHYQ